MNEPKTIHVAVYPTYEIPVIRHALGWSWDRNCFSSHKASALNNALDNGALIERRPNPKYKPRLSTFEGLMKGMKR